jgi:uncharacterized membrane protein YjjP (DUF1212 family)
MSEASVESAAPGGQSVALGEALATTLRFGAAMLRAGDTAFRVREWMAVVARAMGIEALAAQIVIGSIAATARRGREQATLVAEVAPLGIDASRLGALERLAREVSAHNPRGDASPQEIEVRLARIEAAVPLYPLWLTLAAIGAASGSFCYLNGGDALQVVAAAIGGATGQWVRSLLLRRHLNQYAVTALCAVIASGTYCLIAMAGTSAGLALPRHAAGFISSVLFLVPGFPLVGGLNDLLQHQVAAGVSRLAYGGLLLLSAAFGLCLVAGAVGLGAEAPAPQSGELATLGLRAIASAVGGCGFAILYNSPRRNVLAVGVLALVGNELRLALHDAGMNLALATFLGALAVGLLVSLVSSRLEQPRVVLTVPGIIIMVPGIYAFQTIVMANQGDMLAAMQAAASMTFIVGAMAIGLTTARFLTDRRWIVES